MNTQTDLIVDDLCKQVASLAKEKAIFFALATQKERENVELRNKIKSLEQELKTIKDGRE